MKKKLYPIKGTALESLPFEIEWVADLLSYEWPMISIYSDACSEPYLYAWIDGSEKADRYLISKVSKRNLEGYLLKVVPYDDLFRNSVNDEYFSVDISKQTGDINNITALPYINLQTNHKPEKELYLEFEEQSDINAIAGKFELKMDCEAYKFGIESIIELAKSAQNDIINIHLNSSNGKVGYGHIQSHILGQVLVEYNKMAEASALKVYEDLGMRRHSKTWKEGERESVIALAHTDYYATAASFDVKLIPVRTKNLKSGTAMEQITEKIFQLMNIGEEFGNENVSMDTFPQEMLNAYDTFLSIINKYGISVAMQYGNPVKQLVRREYFDAFKSTRIVKQLRCIQEGLPQERKFTGKFLSFHSEKLTFDFRTLANNEISGIVKSDVADAVRMDIFRSNYDIVIETLYQQKNGRLGMSVKNTIVSCVRSHDA